MKEMKWVVGLAALCTSLFGKVSAERFSLCADSCLNGVYLGGFGGADYFSLVLDKMTQVNHPFLMGGGFLGYKFHPNFRAEGEFAYRYSSYTYLNMEYTRRVYSGMFNTYAEMPIDAWIPVLPYIGLGIGNANVKTTSQHDYFDFWQEYDHRNRFAWQALLGISVRAWSNTEFGFRQTIFFAGNFEQYHATYAFTIGQFF